MATYALTYATRAAFDTALASGDIYSLMQGVTSGQPSVAIAAHITESGETFSCGTNVMVDIKSVGPGDYVLYDTTNKKYFGIASKWIDNNRPSQPTQHIMIFKTGVLPARYVVCGTVIKRFGNRIRLAGVSADKPWSSSNTSDYAWNVPTIPSNTSVMRKGGSSDWFAFPSARYQESYFPSGESTYLPITRATWDAAVAAGSATVTQNGTTVTMANYNNSYDRWVAMSYTPKFPAASGCYSDTDGFGNTQKIVAEFIANHSKTAASADYAAGYCYNYTPSDSCPGLEKHSWFLGMIKDMGEVRPLTHTLQTAIAWGSGYLWSCSQSSSYAAWSVHSYGLVYTNAKYAGLTVVPLADLFLNT